MVEDLDRIDPEERIGVAIDFTDELGTDVIESVTASIRVLSGTDLTPANVLNGPPTIVGALVILPVAGRVPMVDYHIRVKVTTIGGAVLVVPLRLRVRRF